jgi:polyphenol oxidase
MELRDWYRWRVDALTFYKAWNLEQTSLVTHVVTTRSGGASSSPFDTLNMALHVGDDPESVVENRDTCLTSLGLDPASLTTVEQVHGAKVAVIGPDETGSGALDAAGAIPGADAMITDRPGAALCIFTADCVPIFIVDPVNNAIGLAHAGWKGTAADIVTETLSAMTQSYGSRPQDCLAAIGPAIGRCCYEVGNDTANAIFKACADDRPIVRTCEGGACLRVDLPLANWLLLRKAGVPEESIALSQRCTCCNGDEFFSYRRDGETGRMASILALR